MAGYGDEVCTFCGAGAKSSLRRMDKADYSGMILRGD